MNILEIFKQLIESSGFMALTWQQAVMIGVSFIFLFLAIVKKFEPLLLLPIAFGMLLALSLIHIFWESGFRNFLNESGKKPFPFSCFLCII